VIDPLKAPPKRWIEPTLNLSGPIHIADALSELLGTALLANAPKGVTSKIKQVVNHDPTCEEERIATRILRSSPQHLSREGDGVSRYLHLAWAHHVLGDTKKADESMRLLALSTQRLALRVSLGGCYLIIYHGIKLQDQLMASLGMQILREQHCAENERDYQALCGLFLQEFAPSATH